MTRSAQESPVPEIGTPGLRWRRLETADTAKGSLRSFAPVLDPTQDREGARPDDPAVGAAAGGSGDCVSRERQVRLAGASPAGARARRPVAWIAGWRETETLKPIDKAIERMVSESPGRNASEREVAPKESG